mmetsp:Transcript_8162/g.20380  ORF Transcript_8162/g.20380 Transcript_8162/m.20380 type:complete len:217 (-) Transcript_8162:789-1439(-)
MPPGSLKSLSSPKSCRVFCVFFFPQPHPRSFPLRAAFPIAACPMDRAGWLRPMTEVGCLAAQLAERRREGWALARALVFWLGLSKGWTGLTLESWTFMWERSMKGLKREALTLRGTLTVFFSRAFHSLIHLTRSAWICSSAARAVMRSFPFFWSICSTMEMISGEMSSHSAPSKEADSLRMASKRTSRFCMGKGYLPMSMVYIKTPSEYMSASSGT